MFDYYYPHTTGLWEPRTRSHIKKIVPSYTKRTLDLLTNSLKWRLSEEARQKIVKKIEKIMSTECRKFDWEYDFV